MESPSLVLASNQQALQQAMDIVANNVANSSTTGFKREGIQFDTLLSRPSSGDGDPTAFVIDRATYRDTSNGPIDPTNNPLDLAIQGSGYFPVQTPQGKRYTRAGSFQLDTDGELVTSQGYPLLGQGDSPITIPSTAFEVNVAPNGDVTVRVDDGVSLLEVGKLEIDQFNNEAAMQPMGAGLYSTSEEPTPIDNPDIVQGALEQSNVQPIAEITNMIQIMRFYEQTVNMIGQENQRLDNAIDKLAKTTA